MFKQQFTGYFHGIVGALGPRITPVNNPTEEQDAIPSAVTTKMVPPMRSQPLIQDMSLDEFQRHLNSYRQYIRAVYEDVELQRFVTIPTRLDHLPHGELPYLEIDEVLALDRWMQKRGTPLPIKCHKRTTHLINGNTENKIKQITSKAFEKYAKLISEDQNHGAAAWAAMDILKQLKGIGNSRATLLLSAAYQATVPYCSRGLFRWTLGDRYYSKTSFQERDFLEIFKKLEEIRAKFPGKTAVDIERVAHVLHCNAEVEGLRKGYITHELVAHQGGIGEGGNGDVYKADQKQAIVFNRPHVAIKKIPRRNMRESRQRFLTEIMVSNQLSKGCPKHFVEFLGWNEDDMTDCLYIAMELAPYGDLETCLSPGWHWTQVHMRTVAGQMLEGIKYMHGELMAHRDLKPQNVLVVASLDEGLKIKIADFGVAKRLSIRDTSYLRTKAGTSGYKAPEVQSGAGRYSYNVDIWSLGCIVYRMARGSRMFETDDDVRLPERKVNKTIKRRLGELGTGLPVQGGIPISDSGIRFIKQLVVFDPIERPDAEEALNKLKKWKNYED